MFVDPHVYMDHPCDHINDAVLPAVPLEEPVREAASTSVSPDIQAPSLPPDTPTFQVPSHSQHEDYLPQLTEEQKEGLMRIHTELTSRENPINEVTSFEFEEPRDQTEVHNAIFKEPYDKAVVSDNAIWGEPQDQADVYNEIVGGSQGKPDDSKSIISESEESGQEEWTPQGKSKQGRPKSIVKRKYTKQDKADVYNEIVGESQGEPDDSRRIISESEESDQEEWTPQGKSKQGRPKSIVKRKYTKRNSAKRQDGGASGS